MRVRSGTMLLLSLFLAAQVLLAEDLPHIKLQNGVGQLIVHGEPFLILGGKLGNSSAGTRAQAEHDYSQSRTHARQHLAGAGCLGAD